MSRLVKVPTVEMGELRLLLISVEPDGRWESEWEPLRLTVFGDQISQVSSETVDHVLHGWSRPLARELGIPPAGALRKIPLVSRQCGRRGVCPLYLPGQCFPEAKKMPWCYEPDGVVDDLIKFSATRAFEYWRDGVYLVVVLPGQGPDER